MEVFKNDSITFSIDRSAIESLVYNKKTYLLSINTNVNIENNTAYVQFSNEESSTAYDRLDDFEKYNDCGEFITVYTDNFIFVVRKNHILSVTSVDEILTLFMKTGTTYTDFVRGIGTDKDNKGLFFAQYTALKLIDEINLD